MSTQAYEVERATTRRPVFSAVRWGAVIAGTVAGGATYLLLSLLGIATGLTAMDPGESVGSVPLWTGLWSLVSMLVAAFVGGWVAGRMSGLRRSLDGMLHGFVAWGLTTLFFAFIATSTAASLLGGAMNVLGQAMQGGGGAGQLERMITGTPGGARASADDLAALQEQMSAQNRAGAIDIMVGRMGFSQERAEQIVDQAMPLFAQPGEAAGGITAASWWLFFTLFLALGLGIWGGGVGTRGNADRTVQDHSAERRHTFTL